MKPASLVTAGALALATAILTVAPVVPAFAAELPDGDTLYTITDWEGAAQLFQLDPGNAEGTEIGSGADSPPVEGMDYYATQGASYDSDSGDAYFIQYMTNVEYDQQLWLGRTDLASGDTEYVGRFHVDGEEGAEYPAISAIAIQPNGDAFAFGSWDMWGCECMPTESFLFQLDLDDASLIEVSDEEGPAAPLEDFVTAFAADPVSGDLFAVGRWSGVVYRVDPVSASFDDVDDIDLDEAFGDLTAVEALAFDSGGAPWMVLTDEGDVFVLVTDDGEGPSVVEQVTAHEEALRAYSLLIEWGDDGEGPAKPSTTGKLFAIAIDEEYNALQLFSVDPTTGLSAPIGSGLGFENPENGPGYTAYQPAYDATTKTAYFIQETPEDGSFLSSINTVTGAISQGPQLFFDEEVDLYSVDSLAISPDGAAFAFGRIEFGDDEEDTLLFSVNLATAELTAVADDADFGEITDGPEALAINAFASDPSTGKFYAIPRDIPVLFEVDVAAAEGDELGEVDIPSFQEDSYVLALQIDGAGRFWVISDAQSDPDGSGDIDFAWWVHLSSFTLGDLDAVEAGMLWDDPFYAFGLLFLPTLAAGPTLAATGVESGGIGVAGAAILLLLLGGAGVLAARRRNATH